MQHFFFGLFQRPHSDQAKQRLTARPPVHSKPTLEILEARLTPTTYTATGVFSGSVDSLGLAVAGATVGLTGTTTTGRQVSYSAVTNANGAFTFNQLLEGTYSLTPTAQGFVGGQGGLDDLSLGNGSTVSHLQLGFAGVAPQFVSLGAFETDSSSVFQPYTPPSGSGASASGYNLDTDTLLGPQSVTVGSTTGSTSPAPTYINLASYFYDPDTVNPTVTFNTTTGQSFDVELYAKDDPVTVNNFLDYIDGGDFNDLIFNRLSSLTSNGSGGFEVPPTAANQVIQGGAINYTASGNSVTGLTALTPFQSIPNESNDSVHPNAQYTIAMARTSSVDSATSQFFFNLTNNSSSLAGTPGNGYAVFGQVVNTSSDSTSQSDFNTFVSQFTANDQSGNTALTSINGDLQTLPLLTGFTPTANSATLGSSTTTGDLAGITSITVPPAPTGKSYDQLTYSVTSSNTNEVVATLGTNANGLGADQLQLTSPSTATAGSTAKITLTITDAAGEQVTSTFVATVAAAS
jgi:peptidyl-prolyl cis-trans isomerase A (cyclophilin A)